MKLNDLQRSHVLFNFFDHILKMKLTTSPVKLHNKTVRILQSRDHKLQFFEIFVIFFSKYLKNFVEIGLTVQKLVFLRPPQWPNQNFPGMTHPAKLKPYPKTKLVPSFIKIVRAVLTGLKIPEILATFAQSCPGAEFNTHIAQKKTLMKLEFPIVSFTTFKKRLKTQISHP